MPLISSHYFVIRSLLLPDYEINRIKGKDRKTIKNYIEKEDWNKRETLEKIENTFPKLDPYKEEIDKWLTDDKKAKRKQRHTTKRVFDRLVEKYSVTAIKMLQENAEIPLISRITGISEGRLIELKKNL